MATGLLTPDDLERIKLFGGDGWRTAEGIEADLNKFIELPETDKPNGLCFSAFKEICLSALLPWGDIFTLFHMVKHVPWKGTYLEIGSYVGGSLLCAWHSRKELTFIAIDPLINDEYHETLGISIEEIYKQNTKDIPRKLIQKYSQDAHQEIEDNSVDVLFIDGSHEYKDVKVDILRYWDKVKEGGYVLLHDFNKEHLGVVNAVVEIFAGCEYHKALNSNIVVVEKFKGQFPKLK